MAGWTRLELATSCVTGRRSNQLNYHPAIINYIFKSKFTYMYVNAFFQKSLNHAYTKIKSLEPAVRVELTTVRLQGGCSATELSRRMVPDQGLEP